MRKTLIVGATSAIAEATARNFAADGDTLFLVARNAERLSAVAADLKVRSGCEVHTRVMDALDHEQHSDMLQEAVERLGGLDVALLSYGTLPDQRRCEQSIALTRRELDCNALSVMSLLTHLANHFERQGHGTIAVISSVAGDRGRQSNYVYGAAKGAVSIFCQGLRNRLAAAGVHVLTVKPGFVDTPMTAAFQKNRLWASPASVGKAINRAVTRRKDVLYVPWFWRYVMLLIRAVPERVFKRLHL